MKNIIIAICLVSGTMGLAVAGDHQKTPAKADRGAICVHQKSDFESRVEVYFEAHRAVEGDL